MILIRSQCRLSAIPNDWCYNHLTSFRLNFSSYIVTMWGASTSSNLTMGGNENDIEIMDPPNSNVSAMEFSSYQTIRKNFLVASSCDPSVYLWEVRRSRKTERKSVIPMSSLILDVAWSIDGTNLYMASTDHKLKFFDLERPHQIFGEIHCHNGPITTCNVIKETNYQSCILTGSCDKTIKIWDLRLNAPSLTINLPDEIACADVDDTMAVVCTKQGSVYVYELGAMIYQTSDLIPPFQSERRCVAIFRDRRTGKPAGFTMGTREGRVISIYNDRPDHEATVFKNHDANNMLMLQPISSSAEVNDIKYHPVHRTLAVARTNGHYSYFNTVHPRPTLLSDKLCPSPINKCCFSRDGTIFAYSLMSNFSKPVPTPPSIFLNYRSYNEMDPAVYYVIFMFERGTGLPPKRRQKHGRSKSR